MARPQLRQHTQAVAHSKPQGVTRRAVAQFTCRREAFVTLKRSRTRSAANSATATTQNTPKRVRCQNITTAKATQDMCSRCLVSKERSRSRRSASFKLKLLLKLWRTAWRVGAEVRRRVGGRAGRWVGG